MATLKTIRKRILSVKNTQKITKAMKMVAAAKLRRAQTAVTSARPYAHKLAEIAGDIVAKSAGFGANPLFMPRDEVKNVEVLVFTSNRGLCGGFNSNLLRRTDLFLRDLAKEGANNRLVVIGKKGRDFFNARKVPMAENQIAWANAMTFAEAMELTQSISTRFINGEFDEYYLVYNRFVSAISQVVTVEKLLPLTIDQKETAYGMDFIYEPSKENILNQILPKVLATKILKAHLESLASELGSRMSAMDSATKNASEMIGLLTLKYNRARQAAITTELMDIVNGAESLKG